MTEEENKEEWTRSEIMKLIELYKSQDCLWNVNNLFYRDKRKRNAAWRDISVTLKRDVLDVERKMKVLKTQFMHCYKLLKKCSSNGEQYQPKWFAYRSLKFLIHAKLNRENKQRQIFPLGYETNTIKIENQNEPMETTSVYENEEATPPEDYQQQHQQIQIQETQNQQKNNFNTIIKELNTNQLDNIETQRLLTKETNPEDYDFYETNRRDESAIFGELVACRLRKIKNIRSRLKLQFNINNLLFNAEMKELDENEASTSII